MLFPDAQAALDHAAGETPVFTPGYDIVAAREDARKVAAGKPREEVLSVEDVDAGGVHCRIYVPEGAVPGTVVHLHGGGFVFNDVDVHDAVTRALANRVRRAVISVDYRLAPEHPFPAAPDDVDTVLAWIADEGASHGLTGPLLGHGDSAGANLALVAALRHPGLFAALALIYPFLDPTARFDSHATEQVGFDPREVGWYWEQYSGGDAGLYQDPDLAPLRSDRLFTLPPTIVTTAEHDPLRGEGEHLARLIAHQGVGVVATRYLGQLHGFWRHADVFDAAEPLMMQVASFLEAHG